MQVPDIDIKLPLTSPNKLQMTASQKFTNAMHESMNELRHAFDLSYV